MLVLGSEHWTFPPMAYPLLALGNRTGCKLALPRIGLCNTIEGRWSFILLAKVVWTAGPSREIPSSVTGHNLYASESDCAEENFATWKRSYT